MVVRFLLRKSIIFPNNTTLRPDRKCPSGGCPAPGTADARDRETGAWDVRGACFFPPGTGRQASTRPRGGRFPAPVPECWFRGPCTGIPGAYPDISDPFRRFRPPLYAGRIASKDPANLEDFGVAMRPPPPPSFPANLSRIGIFYLLIGPGARAIH